MPIYEVEVLQHVNHRVRVEADHEDAAMLLAKEAVEGDGLYFMLSETVLVDPINVVQAQHQVTL